MKTMTLIELSTAHIDKATAMRLEKEGDKNPWCLCGAYEFGFFLYLENLHDPETPQCLRDISDWMKKQDESCKSGWVRLDEAVNPIEDLPTYDWA